MRILIRTKKMRSIHVAIGVLRDSAGHTREKVENALSFLQKCMTDRDGAHNTKLKEDMVGWCIVEYLLPLLPSFPSAFSVLTHLCWHCGKAQDRFHEEDGISIAISYAEYKDLSFPKLQDISRRELNLLLTAIVHHEDNTLSFEATHACLSSRH